MPGCTLTSLQGTPPSPLPCSGCCYCLCFAGEAARPGRASARPKGSRHGPPLPQAGGAHDLQCPARDPRLEARPSSPCRGWALRPSLKTASPSPHVQRPVPLPPHPKWSPCPWHTPEGPCTLTVMAAAGLRNTYLGSFLPLPAFGTCGAGRTLEGVRGQRETSGLPEAERAAEPVGGTGLAGRWAAPRPSEQGPGPPVPEKASGLGWARCGPSGGLPSCKLRAAAVTAGQQQMVPFAG